MRHSPLRSLLPAETPLIIGGDRCVSRGRSRNLQQSQLSDRPTP
ncbi:hypothetical protein VZH09_13660 [Synechococcus elongatus IITB7]